MNKKYWFAMILLFAILIDMGSTHLLVASGYRELTGLIVLMFSISPIMLYVWALFWFILVILVYPYLKKIKFNIQFETIVLWYAITSMLAGVGNLYLYYVK